jgi:chromosome segregation ATPase
MHLSEFDNLESRALKVSNELNRASKTIALRNLNDLLSQLKELDKQLNVQTADATQTSNELQLKSTKEFLTKAKTSLTILKGLKAELDNDTTDLGKKVAAVFKAINDFEEAFPNT